MIFDILGGLESKRVSFFEVRVVGAGLVLCWWREQAARGVRVGLFPRGCGSSCVLWVSDKAKENDPVLFNEHQVKGLILAQNERWRRG